MLEKCGNCLFLQDDDSGYHCLVIYKIPTSALTYFASNTFFVALLVPVPQMIRLTPRVAFLTVNATISSQTVFSGVVIVRNQLVVGTVNSSGFSPDAIVVIF